MSEPQHCRLFFQAGPVASSRGNLFFLRLARREGLLYINEIKMALQRVWR